jgi:hypothetical protein
VVLNTTPPKLENSIAVLMNHQQFNDVNPALVGRSRPTTSSPAVWTCRETD